MAFHLPNVRITVSLQAFLASSQRKKRFVLTLLAELIRFIVPELAK
jgi:hypothetical protein